MKEVEGRKKIEGRKLKGAVEGRKKGRRKSEDEWKEVEGRKEGR